MSLVPSMGRGFPGYHRPQRLERNDVSSINHECSDKETGFWEFRLYIHGDTPRSKKAIAQVEQLLGKYLAGRYRLECIDLLKTPERGSADWILATPTLMKLNPPPIRILGDFSQEEQVLEVMGIKDLS